MDYFTEAGDCKAKCNICSNIIKYSKGLTRNLSRHVKTKHPTVDMTRSFLNETDSVMINVDNDNPTNNTCPTAGSSPSICVVALEMPNQPATPLCDSVPGPSSSTTPIYSLSNTQTRLTSFINKPLPQSRSKLLDNQLVRVIVKEYQPKPLVDDKEFQTFISMLNPGYTLPSRKTLLTNLIPQHYKRVSDMVQSEISQATGVSLTWQNSL